MATSLPSVACDGVMSNEQIISVYDMAANLLCVVRPAALKQKHAEKSTLTIGDLLHEVAGSIDVPPGLLTFVPLGSDSKAERLSKAEDICDLSEVQVVINLAKREEYLQHGRNHLAGSGMTHGERLEDFLWDELTNGSCLRCAVVREREEVDLDNLLIFGAIFEHFQSEEALDEIFYLFDLHSELIEPLADKVLAPLDEILGSNRPDKTAGLIPVVVDWIEALVGALNTERELHIDCFLQALLRHVEKSPACWTLARRRAAWIRDADARDDDDMCMSALWDVFDRLLAHNRLTTWPVAWDFMQRFAGIDIQTLKRITIPGLQTGALVEHGYVPCKVPELMRHHCKEWVLVISEAARWMKVPERRDIKDAMQNIQQRMQWLTDFWISFLDLFSVADIKALHEFRFKRENGHLSDANDLFLISPLAVQIPFLRQCRVELGEGTDFENARTAKVIFAMDKVLRFMEDVIAFEPKVGDQVEVHRLKQAASLNGKRGRVVALQDGDPMRYQVQFDDGSEGKAVKASNLKKRYSCK
eukprot:TRINITY_DN22158_c0_g2_i1.p1 TRINITY_DN22158_c0_g2~~TRINITY_DN22158_c0_g2_i1.p1  ORF type:complete len:530 (+),score=57.00 TRINITY_DN22158_c0_g2_i1:105-1694(+)